MAGWRTPTNSGADLGRALNHRQLSHTFGSPHVHSCTAGELTGNARLDRLSPINSGNTMRNASWRSSETFLKLRVYPFYERKNL